MRYKVKVFIHSDQSGSKESGGICYKYEGERKIRCDLNTKQDLINFRNEALLLCVCFVRLVRNKIDRQYLRL